MLFFLFFFAKFIIYVAVFPTGRPTYEYRLFFFCRNFPRRHSGRYSQTALSSTDVFGPVESAAERQHDLHYTDKGSALNQTACEVTTTLQSLLSRESASS